MTDDERRERNRLYHAKYRAAHPELKAYYAARYQARKGTKSTDASAAEAKRAYNAEYRQRNRERIAVVTRAWRAANPENVRAHEEARKARGRPNKAAQDARYRAANPDRRRDGIARAKAANPDLYRKHAINTQARRRARLADAEQEAVSLSRIEARDRGRCHLCGGEVHRDARSFDHLIPIARRGAHAEWNLMLAHLLCNQRRGTRQVLPVENKAAAVAYIAARAPLKGIDR